MGVLIQLPLPKALDKDQVLSWLDPKKDVDGLTIHNTGRLWAGQKGIWPCTPHGIVRLIESYQIPIQGANTVVIGRSHIVGLPVSKLLLDKGATVTICHSKTSHLKRHTQMADIVIVACGKHHYLNASYFKKSAVVIDVGIHRIEKDKGTVIEGDVCPDGLESILSYRSPVPGGVGPMTIALLLENTVWLASR